MVGAAAGAGLLLVGVIVATFAHGDAQPTIAVDSASGAVIVVPPHPQDPKIDEILSTAQAKIDKGDYATAIDEVSAVEQKHFDRADVHMLLERAYTGVRDARDAMREAGAWLAIDSNAAADPKLEEDVRNAALFRDAQDEAFALLQAKMGTRGIDILYDIAYGISGRQYPQAALRAKHALDQPEVRGRASPALSLILDFRDAKTCDAKHSLLDRARDQGDARLLSTLQSYESSRGCGFLGVTDCYPCMHRDHQLKDTIEAIEDRAAKSP
jgi:serine/threonine-protein kinase